jgi:hypothetical protein
MALVNQLDRLFFNETNFLSETEFRGKHTTQKKNQKVS